MTQSESHNPNPGTVDDHHIRSGPWYRYFMPWFVLCLLLTAVTGSLITVAIAINNKPQMVTRSLPATAETESAPGAPHERSD